jgi:two-component system, cell cycle response regulator
MTAAPAATGARILVVDDHPVNCELLEAMLVPQGYRVECVYSGDEALQVVHQSPPDLVLLDVNMPGMDGFEVTRALRGNADTRLIPVVMVTALGDFEHRVRGIESGAEDYLAKPVNRTELLARVQATLRLSYYRRQVDERQKLELVLADVSDGILIAAVDGTVREENESARRLLALEDDAAGKPLADIWGVLRGAPADLAEAIASGEARDFVLQRAEPPLYVAVCARPVRDLDGKPTGAVLSLRDVTRETLEHRLQEDALSLVSHKFRTPLTVVGLWTKLLLDGGAGPVTKQQHEALAAMANASEQLRQLLEGMLSYLEWTRRLHRLQRRHVPFADLEAALRARVQTDAAGLRRLIIDFDAESGVMGDETLLVEVLGELVHNAVKFAGERAVTVRVELRGDGEHGTLTVSDDGPGIPPEKLQQIFERFFQVEADFTGQVAGLGLGLAFVKTAVEALGGHVEAHSQLDRGTRIEIVL